MALQLWEEARIKKRTLYAEDAASIHLTCILIGVPVAALAQHQNLMQKNKLRN